MVEVTIHFGRADARVQCEHIRGTVHWVNLWATPNDPTNGNVRIFCPTSEAAETLAVTFVACGAQRVNRQLDADFY